MNYKEYLKEYFTNNLIYLKKYLKSSDEEIKNSLPFEFPMFFDRFIEEVGEENPFTEEEIEDYGFIETLENTNKELFERYGEWLRDNIYNLPIDSTEIPTIFYMDYVKDIKQDWLIHFSDMASDIAKDGFKYGVEDMTRLGLTTHISSDQKSTSGYNFAYRLTDFERYGKAHRHQNTRTGWKYGEEAVIFRASGILVDHHSDEEPQVIFDGVTAKDIIYISNSPYDDIWGIYSIKSGNRLVKAEELNTIVDWVLKNFDQYRKHLLEK